MRNISQRYSRNWVRVFYHRYSAGYFPADKSLCQISNEEGRFNSIGKLNDLFKINGVYEFMLDYKENGSIVWQQSVLPTEIKKETLDNVPGLKILYNHRNFKHFSGLKESNTSNSCFDGSNAELENFRFSIGTIYFRDYGIPGPLITDGVNVEEVILWIRVPSQRFTIKSCKRSLFFNIALINLLVILK